MILFVHDSILSTHYFSTAIANANLIAGITLVIIGNKPRHSVIQNFPRYLQSSFEETTPAQSDSIEALLASDLIDKKTVFVLKISTTSALTNVSYVLTLHGDPYDICLYNHDGSSYLKFQNKPLNDLNLVSIMLEQGTIFGGIVLLISFNFRESHYLGMTSAGKLPVTCN